jgi:predicted amidohydrolase
MGQRYDVLLKNGWVVDPVTGRDGIADVGVAGEQIVEIAPDLDPTRATELFDVAGFHVVPGIIDLHMHASEWLGGRCGHKMMARAGVTTALDMAGPLDGVLRSLKQYGCGLNIVSIEALIPGATISGVNPDRAELEQALARALAQGAVGVKIRAGHHPLTPEATARAIAVANAQRAYVAIHAGTTERGSNVEGLTQVAELAAGNAVHIAHINNYCRGTLRPPLQEAIEAIAVLTAHPNVRSESYLSSLNGASAKCENGAPNAPLTRQSLAVQGFEATEAGLEAAILAGWAEINMESGGEIVLGTGPAALQYWRSRETDVDVSFRAHPLEPRLLLATAKRPNGKFVVDCLSTDAGGGIPRNVIVEMGLALVHLQALSVAEFVIKASTNPARILGLTRKGNLALGADADITVLDVPGCRPVMSLAGGGVIMHRGLVTGKAGRMLTTKAGEAAVKAAGLTPVLISLEESGFYRGV